MAKGDSFTVGITSIANDASLTIQPGAGIEAVITSVEGNGAFELYRTDGVNDILLESLSSAGGLFNLGLRVTNSFYLKATNKSGGASNMAAAGVISK